MKALAAFCLLLSIQLPAHAQHRRFDASPAAEIAGEIRGLGRRIQDRSQEMAGQGAWSEYAAPSKVAEGGRAPNFIVRTLEGDILTLERNDELIAAAKERNRSLPPGQRSRVHVMAGKVLLLNFWAPWCQACNDTMPRIEALHREFGPKGLRVIGIASEAREDQVRAMTRRTRTTYPFAMDDGMISDQFDVRGAPYLLLIAANGRVARIFQSSPTEDLRGLIARLLSGRGG